MTHVLATIVCQEGRAVFTQHKHIWFGTWPYANHFRGKFDGAVYIVTPTVGEALRPTRRL